jgi:hypothetical protein
MTALMDVPLTVEYYYKVRWGYQAEFQALFRKSHYSPDIMAKIDNTRS